MKIIHAADIHLGACPDAAFPWAQERKAAVRESFLALLKAVNESGADFLLICGDLFQAPPLLQDLKEADACFSTLKKATVLLIAGNHDRVAPDSPAASYRWKSRVVFFRNESYSCVPFPAQGVTFYGFSYTRGEIREPLCDRMRPLSAPGLHILLAHGGDASHVPVNARALAGAGFDYVAMGHIHKRLEEGGVVYQPGSLEPLDRTETGPHGYLEVTFSPSGEKEVVFRPLSRFRYQNISVPVTPEDTAFSVEEALRRYFDSKQDPHILYNLTLTGTRGEDVSFDEEAMRGLGRIVSVTDKTAPDLDYGRLFEDHSSDLLGLYISALQENDDPVSRRALELGVTALLDTAG